MIRALLKVALILPLIVAAIVYVFGFYPLRNAHPPLILPHATLVIRGAKLYASPDANPLDNATILIRDGRIAAIGDTALTTPADATSVPCDHCVVTAGFWNAHVHFTQRKWANAEWTNAARLNTQLADMLTSRGFTTVVDTGSNLRDTIPIRRRIETGNLLGPFIYTAGAAQYPPDGIPFYLRDTLPKWLLYVMPEPKSPAEAANIELRNIADGADILKLFTGSLVEPDRVLPMPVPIAQAAVKVAHDHEQLAFTHPSDGAGVAIAVESGIDVLAHAPSEAKGVDEALLQSVVSHHMAMIPTLKMFGTTVTKKAAFLDPIYAEVREFHALGGQLIFGTDVGYMTDYTTDDEFIALSASGLDYKDILRMLTTAPAERFNVSSTKGTVETGKLADLVLLDADPATDVTAFSRVRTTIRTGQVIYSAP